MRSFTKTAFFALTLNFATPHLVKVDFVPPDVNIMQYVAVVNARKSMSNINAKTAMIIAKRKGPLLDDLRKIELQRVIPKHFVVVEEGDTFRLSKSPYWRKWHVKRGEEHYIMLGYKNGDDIYTPFDDDLALNPFIIAKALEYLYFLEVQGIWDVGNRGNDYILLGSRHMNITDLVDGMMPVIWITENINSLPLYYKLLNKGDYRDYRLGIEKEIYRILFRLAFNGAEAFSHRVSPKGARGIAQMLPLTYRYVARLSDISKYIGKASDKELAIATISYFLVSLRIARNLGLGDEMRDDIKRFLYLLISYNAGFIYAEDVIRNLPSSSLDWNDVLKLNIPDETKDYIIKAMIVREILMSLNRKLSEYLYFVNQYKQSYYNELR